MAFTMQVPADEFFALAKNLLRNCAQQISDRSPYLNLFKFHRTNELSDCVLFFKYSLFD